MSTPSYWQQEFVSLIRRLLWLQAGIGLWLCIHEKMPFLLALMCNRHLTSLLWFLQAKLSSLKREEDALNKEEERLEHEKQRYLRYVCIWEGKLYPYIGCNLHPYPSWAVQQGSCSAAIAFWISQNCGKAAKHAIQTLQIVRGPMLKKGWGVMIFRCSWETSWVALSWASHSQQLCKMLDFVKLARRLISAIQKRVKAL